MPVCIDSVLENDPAAYLKAAREIRGRVNSELQEMRVGLIGNYTLDFIAPYLVVEGARKGFLLDIYNGPFNQINQQLLELESPLLNYNPDTIVIMTRFENFFAKGQAKLMRAKMADFEVEISSAIEALFSAIKVARSKTNANFIILNFSPPLRLVSGMADAGSDPSEIGLVALANRTLAKEGSKVSGVFVADWAHFVLRTGYETCFDDRLWYWSRNPFKKETLPKIGSFLARSVAAMTGPTCKCLVVDLDNTLWGGVIGEDGIDGIKLGDHYPGNIFKDVHEFLLRLKARGILLGIASKNNYSDVAAVFENHPDCILSLEDFSALEVHWDDKGTSLRRISESLNIGLNSIAFLDDNPAERELVRSLVPEVHVIDCPPEPLGYIEAVEESGLFDQYSISLEDAHRHEMYKANRKRAVEEKETVDLETFLSGLDMSAEIFAMNHQNLKRVAQLINKTNQFNLTLQRLGVVEIQRLLDAGAIGLCMRLKDRFGDNGLVATAIAVPEGTVWEIVSFLMSCRVFGRQAEKVLLSELVESVGLKGGLEIIGLYKAGPKNSIAENFYKENGFQKIEENTDVQMWRFETLQTVTRPSFVSVTRV